MSSGRIGHAEVVEVTFDPSVVSYGTILQIHFSVAHDPTELDRQGPDVRPQYRSAIFASDTEQRRVAEACHQDYAALHPGQPYIYIHDRPKVENLKRLFASQSRAMPVLVNIAGAK